jgi:hypothetical protein
MAQYQVIDHFRIGSGGAEICLIEWTAPGQATCCLQFKGSWAKAEVEAGRLNALAEAAVKIKKGPLVRHERPRV